VGVSQTAAFNTGRHLYSAGRPSGWALAHISSLVLFQLHAVFKKTISSDYTTSLMVYCAGERYNEVLWMYTVTRLGLDIDRCPTIVDQIDESTACWQ